jgi:hypothetical protein
MSTTVAAVVVLCLSLSTGAGGYVLVHKARAMPAPDARTRVTHTGTVVGMVVEPCSRRRRGPCFRPVVDYREGDGGQPKQIVSRTRYSSSPHKKGDRVGVIVALDGGVWIASEWEARQARLQDDYQDKRGFPLTMGWLLIGCAGFGILLAAGLAFWVDRSGDAPSGSSSAP